MNAHSPALQTECRVTLDVKGEEQLRELEAAWREIVSSNVLYRVEALAHGNVMVQRWGKQLI